MVRGNLNWKIPKISALGQNFLDPLPLLFKKGPYRQETITILLTNW